MVSWNLFCKFFFLSTSQRTLITINFSSWTEGYSPAFPVFLHPQKPTLLNSNLIWKQWMKSLSVGCATETLYCLFLLLLLFIVGDVDIILKLTMTSVWGCKFVFDFSLSSSYVFSLLTRMLKWSKNWVHLKRKRRYVVGRWQGTGWCIKLMKIFY